MLNGPAPLGRNPRSIVLGQRIVASHDLAPQVFSLRGCRISSAGASSLASIAILHGPKDQRSGDG